MRLVKALDGETVLAEADLRWEARGTYQLRLQVVGDRIKGWVDDRLLFDLRDSDRPLDSGGVALLCTEGRDVHRRGDGAAGQRVVESEPQNRRTENQPKLITDYRLCRYGSSICVICVIWWIG